MGTIPTGCGCVHAYHHLTWEKAWAGWLVIHAHCITHVHRSTLHLHCHLWFVPATVVSAFSFTLLLYSVRTADACVDWKDSPSAFTVHTAAALPLFFACHAAIHGSCGLPALDIPHTTYCSFLFSTHYYFHLRLHHHTTCVPTRSLITCTFTTPARFPIFTDQFYYC